MQAQNRLSPLQQNLVLTSAILASSMAFIDSTALNVALPALQRSLGLDGAGLLWVVNAYTLFLASLILFGGSLGDVFGKKKIFVLGIILFTLFSAACGLAQSGRMLIIFRALQGVGGALMVPGSLSIITASFPRETRGNAIGTWSMFSAFTTILGPVLGGYLAGVGLWRVIFFINVPLGIVSALLLITKVKEPVRTKNQSIDWMGGLFCVLALGGITFGFIEASEKSFDLWWIWAAILGGAALLVIFIFYEWKANSPMMPLELFKSPSFSGANAMTLFVYGALGSVLFFVPLNLIQVQGYPEKMAGLAVLPFGGTIALLSRLAGKWTDKAGAKTPMIIGPIITGLSFLGFTFIGLTDGPSDFWTSFFPVLLLGGIGMGITVVPLTTTVMNCVTEQNSGVASGVNNTVARLATVLALAILGAVALLNFKSDLVQRLQAYGLSEEQVSYMAQRADRLADAAPASGWSTTQQEVAALAVKKSFIAIFNLIALITAGFCFIGAFLSWRFISARPQKVSLE